MNRITYILVFAVSVQQVIAQTELNTEGLKITPLQASWPEPEALSFLDDELADYNIFCAGEFHRSHGARTIKSI